MISIRNSSNTSYRLKMHAWQFDSKTNMNIKVKSVWMNTWSGINSNWDICTVKRKKQNKNKSHKRADGSFKLCFNITECWMSAFPLRVTTALHTNIFHYGCVTITNSILTDKEFECNMHRPPGLWRPHVTEYDREKYSAHTLANGATASRRGVNATRQIKA